MAPGRNTRRTARSQLPYARPTKQTTSSWSISGLFGLLNPFGRSTDRVDSDSSTSDSDEDSPPLQSAFRHETEVEQGAHPEWEPLSLPQQPPPPVSPAVQPLAQSVQQTIPQQSPRTPPRNSLPFPLVSPQPSVSSPPGYSNSSSLVKNLEPVTRFLVEKAGQPLNEFEAAGIVDYIQRNVQATDKPELFRFSTSPSRGSSPSLGFYSHNQDASSAQARKTLTSNPNGVYRWQGAGSSRPRNRYQSPGFSSRSPQSRIKLSPPKMPLATDTKRRRVGDEAESSIFQRASMPSTSCSTSAVSFPTSTSDPASQPFQLSASSSMNTPNGNASTPSASSAPTSPKTNGAHASRPRATGISTTPAVPSPLRQAWKGNDSPPQPPQASRPTRAADFMTELIKEVTPPKKPDVSNPYQTASPVQLLPKKPVARRQRPAVRPPDQSKGKEPELTAQEIIEATVPKGSKRSRPPPELEKVPRAEEDEKYMPIINKSFNYSTRSSSSTTVSTEVEETMNIDEEGSPSKKRKTAKSPPPFESSVSMAEITDLDAPEPAPSALIVRPSEIIEPEETPRMNGKPSMPATMVSPPAGTSKAIFGAKSSVPKEPSKLRYSYQADKVEVVDPQAAPTVLPLTSILAPSSTATPAPPAAVPSVPTPSDLSPKSEARAVNPDELPKYTFTVKEIVYLAGPSFDSARQAALATTVSSLPTFDIIAMPASVKVQFNWAAAGLKLPTLPAGQWKCDFCDMNNPDSAKVKCTVCDAPRPGTVSTAPSSVGVTPLEPSPPPAPTPAPPVKAFDWAAAGMKPPSQPSDSWTCSLCGLPNSGTSVVKCPVCDNPR